MTSRSLHSLKVPSSMPTTSSQDAVTSPHLYRPRSTSYPYPDRRHTPSPLLRLQSLYTQAHHALRPRTRRKRLVTYLNATNLLRLLWFILLLWGERWLFASTIAACDWDTWEQWPAHARPERLALIADPQLVDPHTYPRRGLLLKAAMFYTDRYMKRNYALLQEELIPSTTIFLGDLFDGGREWGAPKRRIKHPEVENAMLKDARGHKDWKKYSQSYWEREFFRFENIFPAYPNRRTITSLPGNHDIGIGNGIKDSVLNRFKMFFGETSRVVSAGNFTLVLLDSVSLMADQNPRVFESPRDFLEKIGEKQYLPSKEKLPHTIYNLDDPIPEGHKDDAWRFEYELTPPPRILLTHVPLFRNPDTPCGPLREASPSIAIRQGYQYSNVLPRETSADILRHTKARYVFSGDDHDFCEVSHHYGPEGVVNEKTIKSFSWAMGVRRPAFYMLSLWNPKAGVEARVDEQGARGVKEATVARAQGVQGHLCVLPDQLAVFYRYIAMGIFTLVVLTAEALLTPAQQHEKGTSPLLPVLETPGEWKGMTGLEEKEREMEERTGGEGKYWKPKSVVRKKMREERWGVLYGIGTEFGRVAWVGAVFYGWLLWRW